MAKKDSKGEQRAEKLTTQIKELEEKKVEMEEFITNFDGEYKEKKSQLDVLESELSKAKEDSDTYIEELKIQAKEEVSKELDDMKSEIQKNLDDSDAKLKEATSLNEKATNDYNDTLKKIQDLTDSAEVESTAIKDEADKYSKKVKSEADTYYKTTKEAADTYFSEKKDEIDVLNSAAEGLTKELNSREKDIVKKENEQAKLQNELDARQSDAEFGFQTFLRKEREKYDEKISDLKNEIANLDKKLIKGKEDIDDDLKKYNEEELSKIDKSIQDEKNSIQSEKDKINDEWSKINAKKTELETEEKIVSATKNTYERKVSELDDKAEEKVKELYNEIITNLGTFKERCNELQTEVSDKQKTIVSLTAKLKAGNGVEVDQLKEEIKNLNDEIKTLRDSEDSIIGKLKKYNVDSATLVKQLFKIDEYDNLMGKIEDLNKENHQLELEVKQNRTNSEDMENEKKRTNHYKENYEEALSELERTKNPSRKDRLSSFTSFSDFDGITKLDSYGDKTSELNWLTNIKNKMDASEIKISKKLLYAFHTSVKIHDWSPLVVLAGVSGTGKSELPRQYAHHGGMNFLAVPVKPDWDSMQSLFGYYNSIESKFEPTELSRAIYHMQSAELKNTMLLVLLDEMNLAYVELYFSDLLSKFETNRGTDDKIIYELNLGAKEAPEKMEIGKNILWVGTMNEDETTKALSDKVVDRSTLITFPRPRTLVSRRSDVKIPDPVKKLPYSLWEKWCNVTLDEDKIKSKIDIDKYRKIIEDINDKMSKVNRNLGHRVWQSIEKYVFSHPLTNENINNGAEFKKQFDSAFAEAVAFKVMPKLRGIEVSGESKTVLEEIKTIIEQEIPELAEDYKQAMSLSSRIFQWCSAKFMDVEEEGE